jgi:hypothetical protein
VKSISMMSNFMFPLFEILNEPNNIFCAETSLVLVIGWKTES